MTLETVILDSIFSASDYLRTSVKKSRIKKKRWEKIKIRSCQWGEEKKSC